MPTSSQRPTSPRDSNGNNNSGNSKVAKLTAIATKEDPEKLYQLIEIIGTGSYGEVFKVIECFPSTNEQ